MALKLFIFAFFVAGLASQAMSRDFYEISMIQKHEEWMAQYGRVYQDDAEKASRFNIFKNNVDFIESSNKAGLKSYKLGINQFADLTNDEFRSARNKLKPRGESKGTLFKYENVSAVPAKMDWRQKGVVTPIKDQGACGSCWAFTSVASVEGIHKIKTGQLISLSEQELIDCETGFNLGCRGGIVDFAFAFITNHGLTTEANYPYRGVDGACNANEEANDVVTIKGYEDVPANNEAALLKAVAHQPVSVAIDAGGSFQFYSSGIFTGECGTVLDHGVTIVGYGKSADGTKYWLAKNSWGTSWGDNGYIMMQRDVDAKEGLCGLAMSASYPIA